MIVLEQKNFVNIKFLHVIDFIWVIIMPQVTPDCKYPNLIKISSYFFDIEYTSESEGYFLLENYPQNLITKML